jgi:hypothetical protein
MGSCLRVTGSTLWGPTTSQHSFEDPTSAAHVAQVTGSSAASITNHPQTSLVEDATVNTLTADTAMYTSSVELYTTPETYPIYKTRRLVVVVLHKTKDQTIQHHYYRYLVVTPGAELESQEAGFDDAETMEDDILSEEEDEEDLDDTMSDASGPLTPSIHTSVHGSLLVTTSNK